MLQYVQIVQVCDATMMTNDKLIGYQKLFTNFY